MASQGSGVASDISKLSLQPSGKQSKLAKQKKKPVADSWEDEESGSEPDDPSYSSRDREHGPGVAAPPPTPVSPTHNPPPWQSMNTPLSPVSPVSSPDSSRRPEKTDAVARRMIASALGVKAPRMTEEQRAYDKALKEKEKKRRDEEKAAEKRKEEEAEKAKAAMWND